MEINPRVVFERMFGGAGHAGAAARAHAHATRSILDSVTRDGDAAADAGSARATARGSSEYLDNVREIERRIQRTETHSARPTWPFPTRRSASRSFEEHVGLMFDLLAVAYQADLTRVFTFMMARELSNRTYPQIGVAEPHHACRITSNKPEKIAQHRQDQRLSRQPVRQVPREAARRRPTATARCWIIR